MAVTKGHGNPPWSRDETILALELYLQTKEQVPGPGDRRVVALSNLLRILPVYPASERQGSFRNPDGVAFKLQNLRSVATGKGLSNVSKMDRETWERFGDDPELVRELARKIRDAAQSPSNTNDDRTIDEDEDEEFVEGKILTRLHKTRERNRGVRSALIRDRIKKGGLVCEGCGTTHFTSEEKTADAIFEAHHTRPLSTTGERKTTVQDMSLLCANCHRLIHRMMSVRKEWVSIAQLADVKANAAKS